MTVPHRSVHVRAFIRVAEDVKRKRLLSQMTITPTSFCMEPDVMLLTDMQIRTVTVPVHKNQFIVHLNWSTSPLKKELVLVD
jgi:hypothetical protein